MEEIFDPLRNKFVERQPEEEVRQMMIRWLHHEKGVPLMKMVSEYSFTYNGLRYRADIVILGKELDPLALIECKAPMVKMGKEIIDQGVRYNNILKARYLVFTNGELMYCLENREGKANFLAEVPSYKQMLK